jgi:hypothetical protein
MNVDLPKQVDTHEQVLSTHTTISVDNVSLKSRKEINIPITLVKGNTYKIYFKIDLNEKEHMGDYIYNGIKTNDLRPETTQGDGKYLSFTCILDNCNDGASIKRTTQTTTKKPPSFWDKFKSAPISHTHAPLLLPVRLTGTQNPKYLFNNKGDAAEGVDDYVQPPTKGGKSKRKTFKRIKNKKRAKSKKTRTR